MKVGRTRTFDLKKLTPKRAAFEDGTTQGGKKGKFSHKRNGGIVGGGASTWKILLRVPSNQFQFDSRNGGMKYHGSFHLGLGSLRETRVDRYPSHPSK